MYVAQRPDQTVTPFVSTFSQHLLTMPGQTASTSTSQHFKNKRNVVTMLRQSLKEFKLVSTCHNTSQHC